MTAALGGGVVVVALVVVDVLLVVLVVGELEVLVLVWMTVFGGAVTVGDRVGLPVLESW